jgi:hypothetical protein
MDVYAIIAPSLIEEMDMCTHLYVLCFVKQLAIASVSGTAWLWLWRARAYIGGGKKRQLHAEPFWMGYGDATDREGVDR